ncbi:MAG: hypothetical protein HQM16_16465 [Deltaproteobacteria bacterium]|nr:hypothetical protein [Deltaproteobacteria bacterium]
MIQTAYRDTLLMNSLNRPAIWESFASPDHPLYQQYSLSRLSGTLEDCFLKEVPESGSLGVFVPRLASQRAGDRKIKFCSVFSGYTGDAFTHQEFIAQALQREIGVVCVRPKYSDSVGAMLGATANLYSALVSGMFPMDRIVFVRAISFGAQLAFVWIEQLKCGLEKVAFFAPCSARQLPEAVGPFGMTVRCDKTLDIDIANTRAEARVYYLARDNVVKGRDPIFASFANHVREYQIEQGEHFTVDATLEATTESARWFLGEGA